MRRKLMLLMISMAFAGAASGQIQQSDVRSRASYEQDGLGKLTLLSYRQNNHAKVKPGNLRIFPNPASAEVSLQLGKGVAEGGQLEVVNQSGHTVINRDWRGEKLDVSGLAEGMYVVSIRREGVLFSQKLVVKRK
jgi:hypothetical protein